MCEYEMTVSSCCFSGVLVVLVLVVLVLVLLVLVLLVLYLLLVEFFMVLFSLFFFFLLSKLFCFQTTQSFPCASNASRRARRSESEDSAQLHCRSLSEARKYCHHRVWHHSSLFRDRRLAFLAHFPKRRRKKKGWQKKNPLEIVLCRFPSLN